MNQQFGNQIDRIHQNSLFNGGSQFGNQQVARIQQNTISGNTSNPLGAGFGGGFGGQNQSFSQGSNQGGFQNQVNQNQIDRIHQNSLYGGAEQSQGFGQERQIHQRTMQSGMMAQPQLGGQGGFGGQQNFGGQMNQGFGQGVSQNQIDRIHQNSLYNGAEQSQGFGQEQQIHQRSMQSGMMAQPQLGGQGGFGGGSSMMMGGFGGQQNFGGQMNQGFGQGVSQNQIDRIHQNSLFNGAEQSQGFGQEQQIHQRTMQAGMMAQPQIGGQGGFDGGSSMMMGGFGGQQSFGGQQNFGNQMNQGFQQGVSQNQIDRIHQNSLYNGAEQSQGFGQEQQIHARTMQAGMMAQPQIGGQGSFGGSSSMMMGGQGFQGQQSQMMNGSAFRSVMSADQGMTDDAGPSQYPASMYTGRNQYDTVNQSVFSEMAGMGGQGQFGGQFGNQFSSR